MNHSLNIHLIHKTRHICKKCLGRVYWSRIEYIRPDGAFDWFLDVWCYCADGPDKAIVEECYNIHRQNACEAIKAQQNEILKQILGQALADYIHKLSG